MKKVLIVDDDPHILKLIQLYFDKEGYEVETAGDGYTALSLLERGDKDVLLLDLMLPDLSGFDVLRELRKTSSLPVLILTARGDTFDKVLGLELGADDYIEKPFEPKELLARVKAVLRRVEGALATPASPTKVDSSEIVQIYDLTVNCMSYTATVGSHVFEMPPKELELLFFLASYPNRVFSREQLLENVWGFDYVGESRTVDVHVKRIREKLDQVEHPKWSIKTVWSVGYKFELLE